MSPARTVLAVVVVLIIIGVTYRGQRHDGLDDNNTAPQSSHKRRKLKLNPERTVMVCHAVGASGAEELALDELDITTDYETVEDKYYRSITDGDKDGPQAEGMAVPSDQFERAALIRQDVKRQAIYGNLPHVPGQADTISKANV